MSKKATLAARRAALAEVILKKFIEMGYKMTEGHSWDFFWDTMEDYSVTLLTAAYEDGFRLSKSQYNPVWNSALTVAYDAFKIMDYEWERSYLREFFKKHQPNQGE